MSMPKHARRRFAATPSQRMRPAAIDRSRQHYIALITAFRQLTNETNSFIEKAQSLLTNHWAGANWTARTEILKSVDWLIRLGTKAPAPPAKRTPETPRV